MNTEQKIQKAIEIINEANIKYNDKFLPDEDTEATDEQSEFINDMYRKAVKEILKL